MKLFPPLESSMARVLCCRLVVKTKTQRQRERKGEEQIHLGVLILVIRLRFAQTSVPLQCTFKARGDRASSTHGVLDCFTFETQHNEKRWIDLVFCVACVSPVSALLCCSKCRK